jgi:hypothetical protein
LTVSHDYSDLASPDELVNRLLAAYSESNSSSVLVWSSIGCYISTVASSVIKRAGLFLMAPAFNLPSYGIREPVPVSPRTVIVHGWDDNIIPVDHSIRSVQKYRLNDQVPMRVCMFANLSDAVCNRSTNDRLCSANSHVNRQESTIYAAPKSNTTEHYYKPYRSSAILGAPTTKNYPQFRVDPVASQNRFIPLCQVIASIFTVDHARAALPRVTTDNIVKSTIHKL